eukprot:1161223-Pelagomonas_calceolata.AAC.4
MDGFVTYARCMRSAALGCTLHECLPIGRFDIQFLNPGIFVLASEQKFEAQKEGQAQVRVWVLWNMHFPGGQGFEALFQAHNSIPIYPITLIALTPYDLWRSFAEKVRTAALQGLSNVAFKS